MEDPSLTDRNRSLWNKQYANGEWEILKSNIEEERFNALAHLIAPYCTGARILEIGCGEGLLIPKLTKGYKSYLGIDLSDVAIQSARTLSAENVVFMQADMESYVPEEKFDIIIFNESIYYASSPIELITRYMLFLNKNGILATSIYSTWVNNKLIERLKDKFTCISTQKTLNQRGTWYCDIYPAC